MKKILFSVLILTFFSFQYYMGLFNSSVIKINNITVDTPFRYYISRGMQNFTKLDFSCKFALSCQEFFTLPIDKNYNNIVIIYRKFLSKNTLTLSFFTSKEDIGLLKKKFFKNKTILTINQCSVAKEYDNNIYNYAFQFDKNIFIQITASEKKILDKYLKQFCK